MTSREIIDSLLKEVRDTKSLTPERGAEILLEVTSLLGIINTEIRVADMEYAQTLSNLLESETKANHAKIKAEISPEYRRKREARDTKEIAQELNRSLKYYLKAEEYHP